MTSKPEWMQHHANPRISYYLFLRRIYHFPAWQAHKLVKRDYLPPTGRTVYLSVRKDPALMMGVAP